LKREQKARDADAAAAAKRKVAFVDDSKAAYRSKDGIKVVV
jgi:hypothetical protein